MAFSNSDYYSNTHEECRNCMNLKLYALYMGGDSTVFCGKLHCKNPIQRDKHIPKCEYLHVRDIEEEE